jgi:two-component system KDP operon response regulator KdpE
LRRQRQPGSTPDGVVQFGDVKVDVQARMVTKAGVIVKLTPTEFRLLSALINSAGRVVTNPQLLREVWGHRMQKVAIIYAFTCAICGIN